MKTTYLKTIIGLIGPIVIFFSFTADEEAARKEDLSGIRFVSTPSDSVHSSKNSVEWNGVYQGVLPCADCEGIKTRIVLKKDGSFLKRTEYLGKDTKPFTEDGHFVWDDNGDKITLLSKTQNIHYKVGENYLIQLDIYGNLITGELADKYKLIKNKTDKNLEDKKWVLTELNGQPIDASRGFIQFSMETGKFFGNNTCNNFFGEYELMEGNRITFGKTASTMMSCPNMELQNRFMSVLETADNYTIADGVLSLNKARMAPLARFKLSD